jgi:hypothetical protein
MVQHILPIYFKCRFAIYVKVSSMKQMAVKRPFWMETNLTDCASPLLIMLHD